MSNSIFELWTPERIRSAVAEDRTALWASDAKFVSLEDLPKYPYQSIGRLFYNRNGVAYTASASYVDTGTSSIFTAAHVLDAAAGPATDILFIPAMLDKTDVKGKLFGCFPQIPGGKGTAWYVDPGWNSAKPNRAYDLGAVILGNNQYKKSIESLIKAIPVLADEKNTRETNWTTFGYPVQKNNPEIRMMYQTGSFISQSAGAVTKDGDGLTGGVSGGPWLRGGSIPAKTNGIHSGSDDIGVSTVSPYFTVDQLERMTSLLSSARTA